MDIKLLFLALAVGGFLGIGGTCWVFIKVLQLLIALRGQGHPPSHSDPRIGQGGKGTLLQLPKVESPSQPQLPSEKARAGSRKRRVKR